MFYKAYFSVSGNILKRLCSKIFYFCLLFQALTEQILSLACHSNYRVNELVLEEFDRNVENCLIFFVNYESRFNVRLKALKLGILSGLLYEYA